MYLKLICFQIIHVMLSVQRVSSKLVESMLLKVLNCSCIEDELKYIESSQILIIISEGDNEHKEKMRTEVVFFFLQNSNYTHTTI